jgi:hypothetical protein
LTGDGGYQSEIIKSALKRGLAAEQTAPLSSERGDPGQAWNGELTQRHDPEDGGHRGRRCRPRRPAGPGVDVRAAPGALGLTAHRRSDEIARTESVEQTAVCPAP